MSRKVSNDCDDIVTNLFRIYGLLFWEAAFKEDNIIINILLVHLSLGYQFCLMLSLSSSYTDRRCLENLGTSVNSAPNLFILQNDPRYIIRLRSKEPSFTIGFPVVKYGGST